MDFKKYLLKNQLQELEVQPDYFAIIREITQLCELWGRTYCCALFEQKNTLSYYILLVLNK